MRRRTLTLAFLALAFLAGSRPAEATPFFGRLGAGFEEFDDTTVIDLDCTSTTPPALFGCGAGVDGRPLAARGDFGSGVVWELGVGAEVGERTRVELGYGERRGLDLEAEANFRGVSGEQPVGSDGLSRALLVTVAVDLGPAVWRLRPFLAAGAGVAWNETSAVTYRFPSIAPTAVTVVQGGRSSDLAWTAALGVSFRWSDATRVELALQTTDLGELRSDAGEATIVRPSRTFTLDVAGTRADVSTAGLVLSIRRRF